MKPKDMKPKVKIPDWSKCRDPDFAQIWYESSQLMKEAARDQMKLLNSILKKKKAK